MSDLNVGKRLMVTPSCGTGFATRERSRCPTTTIYSNTNTRQKATFSSEFASTPADDLASSNAVGSTASSSLSSKKTMGREGGVDIRQDV
ncbi:hypothetical protein FS842_005407 [Serendipita sp. 407]|nr:hypothetical protein FS842_005407 [Serendipita sp. 407]